MNTTQTIEANDLLIKALQHYADERFWIQDLACWNGHCVYQPFDQPDGTDGYKVAQDALNTINTLTRTPV